MRLGKANKRSRDGELVQVATVAADEQTRRIHAAIARRAFEIFKSRGSAAWHELEDWRSAETELMSNVCFGQTTIGPNLWLGTDASRFREGSIGIWAAPRRLTIFGKPSARKRSSLAVNGSDDSATAKVFRVIALTDEVDPATVTARIRGSALEISAKKVTAGAGKERIAA